MRAVDLLSAGEAFDDLVFLDLPRLPRPGEEVKTSRFVRTVGGGAVITAVAAARQGLRCRIASALTPAAAVLLSREHVDVTNLRARDELPAVSAALSTAGNRAFVTYNGVNDVLEPRLLEPVRRAAASHVHLAFYPARCDRWTPVITRLQKRGVTTSWDFGWNEGLLDDRGFTRLVAAIDYLLVNEQEAMLYSRTRDLRRAIAFWKSHARVTIVKLGARGSRWVSRDLEVQEAAPVVRTVDTTGAGDAFNGGFLAARLRGRSARSSLRAGNRVGALSTRAAGGIDGLPRRRSAR